MKKVLHVGCGSDDITAMPSGFQQGWEEVRFDINPRVNPHVVGTIIDMTAVADDSVDAIYSAHNIEHVYTHQVGPVLREFRRVLSPDGFAVIVCPDIQIIAEHVAEGRLMDTLYMSAVGPITALDVMYGHTKAIAAGEEHMAHRTAFTAQRLFLALQKTGFGSVMIIRRPAYLDIWALATKAAVSEDVARNLAAVYLPPQGG